MTWFQRLLLLTIALTFALVVIGGIVRATGSGLGCPDWPTCHGEIIPPAEKHTLIEFSHRTAASIVGVAFLGVALFAFRTERRRPGVFWLSLAAGMLLVAQIILGGITVKRELPPEIVAAHLATAMLFMGVLVVTACLSFAGSKGRAVGPSVFQSNFVRLTMLAAAAAFATLVLGSYISETEAALACDGWPLCNGSVAPRGDVDLGMHYLHRVLAGLLGLFVLAMLWSALDERRGRVAVGAAAAAATLYITQVLVGAANIWTELADGFVVLHLSLAALLWCLLLATAASSPYSRTAPRMVVAPGGASEERRVAEWAR
jgi:heme A synthase